MKNKQLIIINNLKNKSYAYKSLSYSSAKQNHLLNYQKNTNQ